MKALVYHVVFVLLVPFIAIGFVVAHLIDAFNHGVDLATEWVDWD